MATVTATPADDRVGTRSTLSTVLARPEVGALIGAIAVATLFLAVAPAFRSVGNIGTILYGSSTIGIMAVAVAMLMIGGEFDLSAGVAVTTSGLAAAHTAWWFGLNVWAGVFIALLISLAIGAFNGFLLHKTGLPSFLVTLGTFFVLQGVNLAMTRLITGGVSSNSLRDLDGFDSAKAVFAADFSLGPVNVKIPVVYWVVFTVIAAVLLLRSRYGNWIFAVGGDSAAARAVGVPVVATKIALFMGVGLAAWLLGMHLLFQFNNLQSGQGIGNEFIYIIAAVIGGCLLTGGYGSVVGASVGALIFGMTQLGITYAGWNPDWFRTFLGVMLIASVLVNMFVKRKAEG
ncbi:ABC transporter permease [Phycicoccus sp. CSK15P-2]|uniref:ABC transporter permease n=1 Tax=Phycicoccus sp. CSK15P-2 TaxID=2807627 RepID=UPI00194E84EC|nr:ABC transporter permease [Phycicoccus sp. CSK15P-2]MBM6406022.1 ABC transporter permease [Phycicoccus sp. CSK15P-2]